MFKAIGDTIWGIGQFAVTTGELVGKTVFSAATCQGCGPGQKEMVEVGEQLKHDTEVLLSENEQLADRVSSLIAQLEQLEATAGASSTEAGEKLNAQIADLKIQLSEMEDLANEESAKSSKHEATLTGYTQQVEELEKILSQEADVTKEQKEKIAELEAELNAAKKGKK
jgi:chromosome segregation ATPase